MILPSFHCDLETLLRAWILVAKHAQGVLVQLETVVARMLLLNLFHLFFALVGETKP